MNHIACSHLYSYLYIFQIPRPVKVCVRVMSCFLVIFMLFFYTGSYVEPDSTFLLLGSITILIFSFFFCLLEVYQMILRHKRYFTDIANLVQFSLFPLSIVFALPISDECWCLPSSRWHIGAVAVFLAWVNVILELVYVPLIGSYAVQLKNVYKNFIKLMLLPILLILSFALPFYMLIVQEVPTVEVCLLNTKYLTIMLSNL